MATDTAPAHVDWGRVAGALRRPGDVVRALRNQPREARRGPLHEEPQNAIELQLAQAWQDVLSLNGVSVTADYFALGGDSIRTVQILARARSSAFS